MSQSRDDKKTVTRLMKLSKKNKMNKYQARWNEAKALAYEKINDLEEAIKKFGEKVMFTFRDEIIDNGEIIVYDDQIILHTTINYILFENDPKVDMGSHSTVKEIKELFDEIQIYVPYKKDKNKC